MTKRLGWMILTLAAATTACDRGASSGTLARAAGHELSVTQTAAMIAPQAQLPDRPADDERGTAMQTITTTTTATGVRARAIM